MAPRNPQLSAYDERPDPKRPGQQGVLFRNQAPAMSEETRYGGMTPATALKKQDAGDYNARPDDRATRRGRVSNLQGFGTDEGLYHGTASKLKPGSIIRPGKQQNYSPEGGPDTTGNGHGRTADVNKQHAFATSSMHLAHSAARVAQENRQSGVTGPRGGNADARPYVYKVEPVGPVQSDAEDVDHRAGYSMEHNGEVQSKQGFRVLHPVQFHEHQEAYRAYNEDELGSEPGSYPHAPKVKGYGDEW